MVVGRMEVAGAKPRMLEAAYHGARGNWGASLQPATTGGGLGVHLIPGGHPPGLDYMRPVEDGG